MISVEEQIDVLLNQLAVIIRASIENGDREKLEEFFLKKFEEDDVDLMMIAEVLPVEDW